MDARAHRITAELENLDELAVAAELLGRTVEGRRVMRVLMRHGDSLLAELDAGQQVAVSVLLAGLWTDRKTDAIQAMDLALFDREHSISRHY